MKTGEGQGTLPKFQSVVIISLKLFMREQQEWCLPTVTSNMAGSRVTYFENEFAELTLTVSVKCAGQLFPWGACLALLGPPHFWSQALCHAWQTHIIGKLTFSCHAENVLLAQYHDAAWESKLRFSIKLRFLLHPSPSAQHWCQDFLVLLSFCWDFFFFFFDRCWSWKIISRALNSSQASL